VTTIFNELPEDVQAFILKHRSIIQDDMIKIVRLKLFNDGDYREYVVDKELNVLPEQEYYPGLTFNISMPTKNDDVVKLEFVLILSQENVDYNKDTTYDFSEIPKDKVVHSFRLGFLGSNKLQHILSEKLKPTYSQTPTEQQTVNIKVLWREHVIYVVQLMINLEKFTLVGRTKLVLKSDNDGQLSFYMKKGETKKTIGYVNMCPMWMKMFKERNFDWTSNYKNKKLATRMKKWNES